MSMQISTWTNDPAEQAILLARAIPPQSDNIEESVKNILRDIRLRGNEAVLDYTKKFDGVALAALRVPEDKLKQAYESLAPDLKDALVTAKNNLTAFYGPQYPKAFETETTAGVRCKIIWQGLDSVGLYVPGGTAPLFSAALMLAIPATLAGCRKIIIASPPQKNGEINSGTLAAAWICGVREVYAMGGAQAIAAMAYGTSEVPKVCKILGPGNAYVTAAKQLVAQDPSGAAIDMPAGPSEVMVFADETANPSCVAADMLAQAEHDTLSQAILITNSASLADRVNTEVQKQLGGLSRRAIIEKSLEHCRIIRVGSLDEAVDIANTYAPEHLIINTKNAEVLAENVRNTGSLFLGPYSPETAGDYASGTNHVLPTFGYARVYGGLSLTYFMRSMTIQTLSKEGLSNLAPTLMRMAQAEGLDAHAAAVSLRLETEDGS